MFKSKVDTYLRRVGYTYMKNVGLSISVNMFKNEVDTYLRRAGYK